MSAAAMAAGQAAGAFAPTGVTGEKAKSIAYLLVIVVIIVIIIIIARKGIGIFSNVTEGITGLFQKFGLIRDPAEKALDEAATNADIAASLVDSPFNPKFYKTAPAGTRLITTATANNLANQIWSSVGVLYDDPEQGLAAIKQCTNWCQVSFLADRFNALYSRDLYNWLKVKYDTDFQKEMLTKIVNYARALPKYN